VALDWIVRTHNFASVLIVGTKIDSRRICTTLTNQRLPKFFITING